MESVSPLVAIIFCICFFLVGTYGTKLHFQGVILKQDKNIITLQERVKVLLSDIGELADEIKDRKTSQENQKSVIKQLNEQLKGFQDQLDEAIKKAQSYKERATHFSNKLDFYKDEQFAGV